ncbi:MAG: response regulator [Leptospiraceae bacterium]|nr:response regulator [Leptospiraceae bacterium]
MTADELWLVDDDSAFLAEFSAFLSLQGFACRSFVNPQHVLGRLRRHSPAAMILDLEMPQLNGLELLQKIRRLSRAEFIPAVLLTGSGSSTVMEQGFQKGLDDYLEKPCNTRELVLRLRSRLRAPVAVLPASFASPSDWHKWRSQAEQSAIPLEALLVQIPILECIATESGIDWQTRFRALCLHGIRDELMLARPEWSPSNLPVFQLSDQHYMIGLPIQDLRDLDPARPLRELQLWRRYERRVMGAGLRFDWSGVARAAGSPGQPTEFHIWRLRSFHIPDLHQLQSQLPLLLDLESNRQDFSVIDV